MSCLRVQKCCCFPLSYGCVMLTLLYMAWLIYELIYRTQQLDTIIYPFIIIQMILDSIVLFTSLFMIFGSVSQKRLFMLPQIMCELIMLISATFWASLMFPNYTCIVLLLLAKLALLYGFSFFHCIIIWSRIEEIGELKGVNTKTEV